MAARKTTASQEFGGDVSEQRFSEAFDKHKQHLAWVAVAVIVLIGAGWFYVRSSAIKAERADAAYRRGLQSMQSGNAALAESDLRQAATRYEGTVGGAEASIALARLYYAQGNYAKGIDAVKGVASKGGDMQFDARMLQAVGYESMGKWKDAASAYESALGAARFDADKATARASEARAMESGGDRAGALKIWQTLADDPNSGFENEAKVRVGELSATAVKG